MNVTLVGSMSAEYMQYFVDIKNAYQNLVAGDDLLN